MKFGFVLPSGDARTAAEFAREAEQAGWDGFFVWEAVWGTDAWVSLAAAAMLTERIRLGTMLTPLPIRKPWKLASETSTLDRLSGGRVILSVGLGAVDTGFGLFGEETDRRIRAEQLDEGLAVLTGLWAGQPFAFEGKHYHVQATTFNLPPPPVQQPRIPIWVVGAWPRERSMQRALRWDGLIPNRLTPDGAQADVRPEDIREMRAYVDARRGPGIPYDIVVEGKTPGDDAQRAAEIVRPWAEAGATWFNDAMWDESDQTRILARIRQGPPRI
jgi:alkanesulfonate monooxygenase SsuD/methylene tetrahydromethanopterin reductase-like flavin-dependent oxidoreductase (luciferase family)